MPFEYDLIAKTLTERYMDRIASFVRGVDVVVERIEDKEAFGGTEDFRRWWSWTRCAEAAAKRRWKR